MGKYFAILPMSKLTKLPLYRNSIYIYLNTIVSALFGFIFWILAARLYTTEQIGITSGLLSVAAIISSLSGLGFNGALIRFLPSSNDKNTLFNSTLLISLTGGVLLSLSYLVVTSIFSKSQLTLTNPSVAFFFLCFSVFQISSIFTNYGLMAIRKSDYSFFQYLGQCVRIPLLIPLVFLGMIGIFASIAAGYLAASILGFYFLSRSGIKLKPHIDRKTIRDLFAFSFGSYINDLLSMVEIFILPIIVLTMVGAKEVAYFYIAFQLGELIFNIPSSIFLSMFVEGSHNESLGQTLQKSIKFVLLFLIPGGIVLYLVGPILLSIFGSEYSKYGSDVLRILIVSSIFFTINTMCTSIAKIRKQIDYLLEVNIILFITIISLSYYLTKHIGMMGAALGWTAGQGITAIIAVLLIFHIESRHSKTSNVQAKTGG